MLKLIEFQLKRRSSDRFLSKPSDLKEFLILVYMDFLRRAGILNLSGTVKLFQISLIAVSLPVVVEYYV